MTNDLTVIKLYTVIEWNITGIFCMTFVGFKSHTQVNAIMAVNGFYPELVVRSEHSDARKQLNHKGYIHVDCFIVFIRAM